MKKFYKNKLFIEISVLLLFIITAFLHSNITGMVAGTAVIDASVAKATIPCVYLISPTIFEQKDYVYMVSYIENCGNQPMNITMNITASHRNITIANASLNITNLTLIDREIHLSLVFPANIPYSSDTRENIINITMTLNYTDYYNSIIKGFVKIPRKLYVITKPPLILKPVDSLTGAPKKIDNEFVKELVKNNSFEKVDKNATKTFIETYSNYVQVSRNNVSFPLNISENLNFSDIDTCSANQTYLGEEVFCNVTLVKGHSYILHIGYGSVHIYAEDVSDDLIEQIKQELIAEGLLNKTITNIIYSEDSKEITTIIEKESPIALMDLDTTPHFTLLKDFNYITFIKVKNSGTIDLNNIKIKLTSALKTNILSNSQINLKAGESVNIPIEIIPDIKGNYWIIAEVESDKTSKKIGINIDIPSDDFYSLKESLESYEKLMKSMEANISNYQNSEEIKPIVDDSINIIKSAYNYYELKDYEKVTELLERLRENILEIINKISSRKSYIENPSDISPSGQFTFSREGQDITILFAISTCIAVLLILLYMKKTKCQSCGRKIEEFKCMSCKKVVRERNHTCGKSHLIPKCPKCKRIEFSCRCKK